MRETRAGIGSNWNIFIMDAAWITKNIFVCCSRKCVVILHT